MAPTVLRTLLAAAGLNLATHAAAFFEADSALVRKGVVTEVTEDMRHKAQAVQSIMAWQADRAKHQLSAYTRAAVQEGRRLQSAAPCLWSNSKCDISPAYLVEKAGTLPQTSPLRSAVAADAACAAKDVTACGADTTCTWNDGPKTCNVNVGSSMDNAFAALFDPATCGTSDAANALKARIAPDPCASLSQTTCAKKVTCAWVPGFALTGMTCTAMSACMQADSGDGGGDSSMAGMCPSTYDPIKADTDCGAKMHDPTSPDFNNNTALTLCLYKGCPLMLAIQMQQMALDLVCNPLAGPACVAKPSCSWQPDPMADFNCTGNPDVMGIILGGLPDACKMKGFMTMQSSCGAFSTQGTCTGKCAWNTESSCSWDGKVQSSTGCGPSNDAMADAIQAMTSGSPVGLLGQAQMNCQMATSQATCTAVTRPAEGATASGAMGLMQHKWLAAPTMLAAALAIFAGVQLF